MRIAFLLFLLVVGYLIVRHVASQHPTIYRPVQKVIQQEILEPIGQIYEGVPALQRLRDWLPRPRPYLPNPYGYGGLDPAGGERKGGDGRGIPDAVSVGWWNGDISYSEKRLSPVEDTERIPDPQVAEVGWWGDDWFS